MNRPARRYTLPPPFLAQSVRPSPWLPPRDANGVVSQRALKLFRKISDRQKEALRLYEPVPAAVDFHRSPAKIRLLVGGNRSSKTFSAAWEVAARAAGMHPRYTTPKGGLSIYVVGRNRDHIGDVLWPKLGKSGQFQIIRDPRTGEWRSVKPDHPYDKEHRDKWRDAPPLLSQRFIKNIAWDALNKGIPKIVRLKNGSTITFFTASGRPRRGFAIDLGWIDEEPESEDWIHEINRARVDRNGSLILSMTPQSGTLWPKTQWDLSQSPWNQDVPFEKRAIDGWKLLARDNPYIDAAGKQSFYESLLHDPYRLRVMWDGEFALDERVVYSEFGDAHKIDAFWPTPDWNRYLVIDPGITTAAVLFFAVAPDVDERGQPHPHAGEYHAYDELYLRRCGAQQVAKKVAERIDQDQHAERSGHFCAFIIDGRAGRQTQMGSGRTIESDYRDAFRELGITSRVTGSGFLHGSDDVLSREEALHRLLQTEPGRDRPWLLIHKQRCRSLIWEMPQQLRKQTKDGLVLPERVRKDDHITTCTEYAADYSPRWVYFAPKRESEGRVWRLFKEKQRKRNADQPLMRFGAPA